MAIPALRNIVQEYPLLTTLASAGFAALAFSAALKYSPISTIVTCILAGKALYDRFQEKPKTISAQDLTLKIQEGLRIIQEPTLILTGKPLENLCKSLRINPADFQNLWTFFPGAEKSEVRKTQFLEMLHIVNPSLCSLALQILHDRSFRVPVAKMKAPSTEIAPKDPISQEIIPKNHLIYLGKTAFDDRSLFLSLVNSPRCLNPVTNEVVTDQQLEPLCKKFHLKISEFRSFWKTAETSALTLIRQESSRLYPLLPLDDAQTRYLLEHDEEIRNHQRTIRQQRALELLGDRDPLLAVEVRAQLE